MKKSARERQHEIEQQFAMLQARAEQASPGIREALNVYGQTAAAQEQATAFMQILQPAPPRFTVLDRS